MMRLFITAMVEVVVAMASTLEIEQLLLVLSFPTVSIYIKRPKVFSVVCSPES